TTRILRDRKKTAPGTRILLSQRPIAGALCGATPQRSGEKVQVSYRNKNAPSKWTGLLAPPTGFDPVTPRLTVECSAVELWGKATNENYIRRFSQMSNRPNASKISC